jgi:phage terminase Nu1 subunit (DNA packaging protein)
MRGVKKHELPSAGESGGRKRSHDVTVSPTSLHSARTRKEIALAELREIEVRRKREDLVDAGDVAREWAAIIRAVRAAVLAVPSRVRARLPHLTPHDGLVLDEEVRAALTTLADDGGDLTSEPGGEALACTGTRSRRQRSR